MSVSSEKKQALKERFIKLEISEEDIDEKFIRSGGKGGQNVNKVSTCVYLKHLSTGIEIKNAAGPNPGAKPLFSSPPVV